MTRQKANNAFRLAGEINLGLGDGRGRFGQWPACRTVTVTGLPRTKADIQIPCRETCQLRRQAKGSFTCLANFGAGAVAREVVWVCAVLSRRVPFAGASRSGRRGSLMPGCVC